jgi:hypothetical protein
MRTAQLTPDVFDNRQPMTMSVTVIRPVAQQRHSTNNTMILRTVEAECGGAPERLAKGAIAGICRDEAGEARDEVRPRCLLSATTANSSIESEPEATP